jgi:hypothetical protein
MSDAQWLLIVVALIYLSECVVWLRPDAVAIVVPLFGRPAVRRPSTFGNERGALAFTTLLPARALFVCEGASFKRRELDRRLKELVPATRFVRALSVALFLLLFAIAPAASMRFGFAQLGLLIIAALVLANAIAAIAFFRAHKRVDPADRAHRWTHAIVMLVSTPAAIRAMDQVTRGALREFDPIAVAARVAGEEHPEVRRLLRELAHPAGGAERGARYEAARHAGFTHVDAAPRGACPRCLAQYGDDVDRCADCDVALAK